MQGIATLLGNHSCDRGYIEGLEYMGDMMGMPQVSTTLRTAVRGQILRRIRGCFAETSYSGELVVI